MYRRKKDRNMSNSNESRDEQSRCSTGSFDSVPQTPPISGNSPIQASFTAEDPFERDNLMVDENEFRRALDRCYTQSQNANHCKLNLKKVPARSAFEKLLEELGLELCENNDDEISLYLAGNFHDLVKELDLYCGVDAKKAKFFPLFEDEIVEEVRLRIYLSPIATGSGYTDTFIRALLTSKSSQTAIFELILKRIEFYAKNSAGDEVKNDQLALACIAQFRYVDTVYDCKQIFNAVFDCDIENWRCAPRDNLIQAMPEILSSPGVHQDSAVNLQQMFLKGARDKSLEFRITILQTLPLLRTNEEISNNIRGTVLQNIMNVEMEVLPDLVKYCLSSIQRSEKLAFRNTLYSLRKHMQIEELKSTGKGTSKKTVGQILTEIFEAILKKTKSGDGRYWKDVLTVLNTDKSQQTEEENEDDLSRFAENFAPVVKKELELFDVLLCFALMDTENGDRTIHSLFRRHISHNRHFYLEKLVTVVLGYTEFTTRFFQPVLDLWENLMWSSVSAYVQFGAFGFKTLFLKLSLQRPVIFKCMLQHLNEVEEETTAMLIMLQDIASSHGSAVASFFPSLSKKLSCLTNLSCENVCRFFNILLLVEQVNERSQHTEQQQGLSFEIERMISSSSMREKIWGILGVLMQLKQYLVRNSTDDRENMIKQKLALLEERTKDDAYSRSCFYKYFAGMMSSCATVGYSTILVAWTEKLCLEFQRDYVIHLDKTSTHCRLEDERYANLLHKDWLCLSGLVVNTTKPRHDKDFRIIEPIAHFQLLLALTRIKHSWDEARLNDGYLAELLFVLKANISTAGINLETKNNQERILNCDIFFICIQWIRLILNTFAGNSKIGDDDAESVHDILRRRFALMMECQKSLKFTIQKIGMYKLPFVDNFEQTEVVVFCDTSKNHPTTRAKKGINDVRENVGHDVENSDHDVEGDVEDRENDISSIFKSTNISEIEANKPMIRRKLGMQKLIDVNQLTTCFIPLSFAATTRLIELLPKKRKQTTFLLDTLHKLLEQLLPKDRKPCKFTMPKESFEWEKVQGDDNPKIIWRSIHSLIPTLFVILHGAVEYFKDLLNTSVIFDSRSRSSHTDMIGLMHSSLIVFHDILSSIDLMKTHKNDSADEERLQRLRMQRRKTVLEKLERAMIDAGAVEDTEGEEDEEVTTSNYFISISGLVPSIDCAVALLQLLSCDFVNTSQKLKAAKVAISYLKKEWSDAAENPVKGASFNRAVATILRLFLSFRGGTERLSAIQWILANKVSELVPEEECRRSKISSLEPCHDRDLDESEGSSHFFCFKKTTFGAIYKVLFGSLNETVRSVLPLQAVEKGKLCQNNCFALWKIAASSFCLLTLLIRVKELRNTSVLLTAAREGRLFLQNFIVKSSFVFLLSDETRFAKYGTGANAVLKTVQIGNRSLQNMSAHAKSTKCASLLKLLPQLRAASEQFIRVVHKLMVGVHCDDAFQIGLLKSRNLDGEELKEPETDENSGLEGSQQRSVNDEVQNDDVEHEEDQSDVEMVSEDESPIF